MARVYVSSTAQDLEAHRRAVLNALLAMKQNVAAMEYYVAAEGRPPEVCIRDVEASDIYVGIFAWRYGSTVPWNEPPQPISITELGVQGGCQKEAIDLSPRRWCGLAR